MTKFKTVGDAFSKDLYYLNLGDFDGKFPFGKRIPMGSLDYHKGFYHTEPVYCPPMCEGGDYGNTGFVGQANYKYFYDNFRRCRGVCFTFGGHGSYGVIVRASCKNQNVIEALCKLTDYPILDEDLLAEVEMKGQEEAWKSWAHSEFR